MKRRRSRRLAALAVLLPAAGAAFLAAGLYIPAKAALAQMLLERAWARAEAGERDAKPWPWADIIPVARIEIPRLNERAIVLEGTSGAALAFGPGHMPNSAAIGTSGTAIVAAHRDTQFRFLKDMVAGDRIAAQTADGRRIAYLVSDARIVRADASGLDPADAGPSGARLALVTFSGVLHSPWRYVVIADRAPSGASRHLPRKRGRKRCALIISSPVVTGEVRPKAGVGAKVPQCHQALNPGFCRFRRSSP